MKLTKKVSCFFFKSSFQNQNPTVIMFKKFRFLIISGITVFLGICLFEAAYSQNGNTISQDKGLGISGIGLEIGWYNPAMDYWKNESAYYKTADFMGAMSLKGFIDLKIRGYFHGQAGVGYWQEVSSDLDLDSLGYGKTKLSLTGLPINIDLFYYLKPLQFSIVTPIIGIGGEVLFIQHKENFENKEDPDSQWGSTILGTTTLGFEIKASDQFALDLGLQYKFGTYNQDFNVEVFDSEHPENPKIEMVVTEKISLSGPKVGVTLKYLF